MSFASYTTYLEKFDKRHDKQVERLYQDKFLICIRHASEYQVNYVRGRVAAEMKKKVVYNVDVSFDNHGVITECQCECGAGMGPEAHCKHVSVVIYALIDFSEKGTIYVQGTCTDSLQSFHKAKKFKGSPVKSHMFTLTTKPATPQSIATVALLDPRPVECRNVAKYKDLTRHIILNNHFAGIDMPLNQLYEPANLYAVAHDHDYLKYSPEDLFLQKMNISIITEDVIKEVESNTRGQSNNKRWVHERMLRITSSNFGRICKATSKTDLGKFARELLKKSNIRCKATEHGKMYEKTAVFKYEEISGNESLDCGLIVCKDYPFLASSPDGLVSDDKVVEVKCPYSARNSLITSSTVKYLHDTVTGLQLNTNHEYYYQVQGQMMCTGRRYCDFVIFTFEDFKVCRIERNEEFIAIMTQQLESFYKEHFKRAVLEKYFYHNYGQFKF